MTNFSKVAKLIIKTVQEDALLNGFQYIVSYSTIEEEFNIKLTSEMVSRIVEELEQAEEVAYVECDDYGLDIVLYTDYAPNYIEED